MGRFYKTEKAEFVDDIIYQPPWELMATALQAKQQNYDTTVQTADLLGQSLKIRHLDFAKEKTEEIKNFYQGKLNDMTNRLSKNPSDTNKIMLEMKQLSKDLQLDRENGNISYIEKAANDFANFEKESSKEALKDPFQYQALKLKYYEDLKNRSEKDITAQFNGSNMVSMPHVDTPEMRKLLGDMKADVNVSQTKNGSHFIYNTGVKEADVQGAIMGVLREDSNYAQAMQQYKLTSNPNYFTKEGSSLDLAQYKNKKGEIITKEEAEKLYEKWDKKSEAPYTIGLNPEHGFTGGLNALSEVYGYNETEYKDNRVFLQNQSYINSSNLERQKTADKLVIEEAQQENRKEIEKIKANAKSEENSDKLTLQLKKIIAKDPESTEAKAAQQELSALLHTATAVAITNAPLTYDENLKQSISKQDTQQRNIAIGLEQKARSEARGVVKSKYSQPLVKGFLEYYDLQIKSGKKEEQIVKEFINKNGPLGQYTGGSIPRSYEDLVEDYVKAKKQFFVTKAAGQQLIPFEPLGQIGSRDISEIYNNSPSSFKITTIEGKSLPVKKGKAIKYEKLVVSEVAGQNENGPTAYKAIGLDGEQYLISPTSEVARNLTKNTLLSTLPENSLVKKSVQYQDISNFEAAAQKTNLTAEDALKTPHKFTYYYDKHSIPIQITSEGIFILGANGLPIHKEQISQEGVFQNGFQNSAEVVAHIYKLNSP